MSCVKLFLFLFFFILTQTSAQKGLGEICKVDAECVLELDSQQRTVWCDNGQCSCRDGYGRLEDRCVIGGDCTTDGDCSGVANSYCNNLVKSKFYCACKDGFIPASNETECLAVIGNGCATVRDCANGGSADVICRDGVCACSDNTVPTMDSRQCIAKVEHGGVCKENIQCSFSDYAECTYGTCKCKNGYDFNGVTCSGGVGLGSPCQIDAQCSVEGDPEKETVACISKQCACQKGYKRDNNRCVIGGDCASNTDCEGLKNSWCDIRPRIKHNCNCNQGFVPALNDTQCLPIAHELGTGCQDTAQCTSKLGDAYCSAGHQCSCVEGAHLNDDKTKCTKGAAAVGTVISISCLALVSLLKFF